MALIRIIQGNKKILTDTGSATTFLDLLQQEEIEISAVCGGNGICGKCRVKLIRPDGESEIFLACQRRISEELSASVPGEEQKRFLLEVPEDGRGTIRNEKEESFSLFHYTGKNLLAAVDLGTTTVAVRILDPDQPDKLLIKTAWNNQGAYGSDVISRIQYTEEHANGLLHLQKRITLEIKEMIRDLLPGRPAPDGIFIAGNSVMEHIAAGISPSGIARAPFTPQTRFDRPGEFKLDGIPVWYSPCVSGYVGGDITAGLYATGITDRKGKYLYLDIGTNGEMALSTDGIITCCAVASGPAFEGAGVSCGMAAEAGAISHIRWDRENRIWDMEIISTEKTGDPKQKIRDDLHPEAEQITPAGICGSGLLDLLAELLRLGIVDQGGRLLPPDEIEDADTRSWLIEESTDSGGIHLKEDENGNGLLLLTEDIYFTAGDVRQLQMAKAAVAAGIDVLLGKFHLSTSQIDSVILAGGFGTYLNVRSAAAIGLIPDELTDQTEAVGNASLSGITLAASNPDARTGILQIQQACRYIELSGNNAFNTRYIEQMMFLNS